MLPRSSHNWFRDSAISRFRDSAISRFRDFVIPRFRDFAISRFHDFAIPWLREFAISRFWFFYFAISRTVYGRTRATHLPSDVAQNYILSSNQLSNPTLDPFLIFWFPDFVILWFYDFVIRFTPIKCCHVAVIIDAEGRWRGIAKSKPRNREITES